MITKLTTNYANVTSVKILHLNSKGLAISRDNYTCEYNSDNYLIKEIRISPPPFISNTNTYSISNGNNVVKLEEYFYNSQRSADTINYKYSNYLNTIGNENLGQAFLGKQNKNLLLSSNIVYTIDNTNRVTSVKTDTINETKYYYAN